MEPFHSVLAGGIVAGVAYGACALGMQFLYLPTRAINFAQGELMVLGAALLVFGSVLAPGLDPLLVFALSAAVAVCLAAVLGRPLFSLGMRLGPLRTTLALIGLSMFVKAISELLNGGTNHVIRLWSFSTAAFFAHFSSNAQAEEGLTVIVNVIVLLALAVIVHFNRLTERLDGLGSNPRAFSLWEQSRDVGVVGTRACLALGLLSGMLLAPLNYADPYLGVTYGIHGFAVMLFSARSAWRALGFGLLWGVLEQITAMAAPRILLDVFVLAVLTVALLYKYGGLTFTPWLLPSLNPRKYMEELRQEQELHKQHTEKVDQ